MDLLSLAASLLALGVGLVFVVGPILGILAYSAGRRHERELRLLQAEVAALHAALGAAPPPEEAARPAPVPPEPEPGVEPASVPAPEASAAPEPEPVPSPPPVPEPALAARAAASPGPRETIEERLASRWILWLGAVTLALGGVFLVKYAIDREWLGPAARVAIGLAFGTLLVVGGEWLRERPSERALDATRPSQVPAALTAAGVSIAYTSAYAGFALYDLTSPLVAFLLLGAISAGAVFLALLQGPLIALIGVLGGYVTPLLVPSDQPTAWALFVYLAFILASGLAIVRFTGAWWLGLTAIAGAVLWPLLWIWDAWQAGDAAALGTYLVAVAALALFVPNPALLAAGARTRPEGSADALPAELTAWVGVGATAAVVFVLLRMDGYGGTSLLTLAVFALLCLGAARRMPRLDAAALIAEALVLAGVAAWHLPQIIADDAPLYTLPHGFLSGPIAPPDIVRFLWVAAGLAALLGIAGFAVLWRAPRPGLWAAMSGTAPVALLAIAYWRIQAFGIDLGWAVVALALAALAVAAASRVERRRGAPGFTLALGAYAAAAVAAISLGATMALQQAWLTVALSLQLPALAWLATRLELKTLRPVALAIAAVVLVRLVLNWHVIDYPVGTTPLLNWMLYGYLLPAAAFLIAAVWFRRQGDGYLVMVLEGGAIAFAALFATLEIHEMAAGSLDAPRSGLLEPSLQSIVWLAMATGIAMSGRWSSRPVPVWAHRILAGLAVAQILAFQVLAENPLWSDDPVGTWPVLNLLLLAYGLPAALLLVYERLAIRSPWMLRTSMIASLVLLFIELSLEVRRGFQGPMLSSGDVSDTEWYAYSAAWLGFAGLLLAFGIRTGSIGLRYASLGVLLLTVGKVFLSDMDDLTGLLRVASFVGLGLCLIGVGWLYQRFVLPRARPPAGPAAGPEPATPPASG